MLKCLIVDDEMISRVGVYEALDWSTMGIEVVGLAKNGKEGLKFFNDYTPDIVITDVKMPVMDGLQLVEEITRSEPSTKIILISAYSEFSYAQRAIRFGVKNYLLKPVDDGELKEAVTHLSEELKKEQVHKHDGQLRQLMDKGAIAVGTDEGVVAILEGMQLSFSDRCLASGIFRGCYLQLFKISRNEWPGFLVQQDSGFFSDLSMDGDLVVSYEQASHASVNSAYWQLQTLSWTTVLQQRRKWLSSAVIRNQTMVALVENYSSTSAGHRRDFLIQLDNLLRMLRQYQGIEGDVIWRYCYEILLALEKRFFILGDDANKLKTKDQLSQAETFVELSQCLREIIEATFESTGEISTDHDLIRRIKNIVKQGYSEDISSKSIAEEVFLTPNYMGKVFREITGSYLNDYIVEVRMEIGRELLANTDQPIAEIAAAVGISSSSYFTLLFKKTYKQTPKEYRRSNS